jgi:hypothetical protein
VSAARANVASHIGESRNVIKMDHMRRSLPRLAIACAAFLAGSFIASIHQHLSTKQLPKAEQAAPAPPPAPLAPVIETEVNYPEDEGVTPRDIEYFINRNPRANLTRLAERLGLRDEESGSYQWYCRGCTAQRFHYNLDDDNDEEILLRIASPMSESYRYLIFKKRGLEAQLLGDIVVWSKYRPSSHAVLLSGGKSWLVIDGQAANGSGLAAYHQTIYRVSSRDVKPVLSYLSEIHQAGHGPWPDRILVARPVSIEVENGNVKGTVAYTVEYFAPNGREGLPLFAKRQTGVLVGSFANGSTRLDANASDMTPHEFETVFNFDSLFEDDFLKYNHSELCAIAAGSDREKKEWLKDCLATFENSGIKRELLSLLR